MSCLYLIGNEAEEGNFGDVRTKRQVYQHCHHEEAFKVLKVSK